jgi:hypothetical protein
MMLIISIMALIAGTSRAIALRFRQRAPAAGISQAAKKGAAA